MSINQYHIHISAERPLLDFHFREIWNYRDLILLFVRRTFVAQYKQTILGPAWAIVQPFFTTVVFTVFFGKLAGLAPNGVPTFLFYLSGSIAWSYFSGCLTQTAGTFTANAAILGKVYFPRLVMSISTVLSHLISFGIQFVFFLMYFIYYIWKGAMIQPNATILLFPILILQMACLSMGVGVLIAAMTTKYRDLVHLVSFGIQLWMFVTPVAYDITLIPPKYEWLYMLNPMTPIINLFRYAFLGTSNPLWNWYGISWITTILALFLGVLMFNRVEKTFMDTI